MCVIYQEEPEGRSECVSTPRRRNSRVIKTLVKLLVFAAVLGFAIAVLKIAVEVVAAGGFVSVVIFAATRAAATLSADDKPEPDGTPPAPDGLSPAPVV